MANAVTRAEEIALRLAAERAAPVFAACGWKYGFGDEARIPTAADIYNTLLWLAQRAEVNGKGSGTGRLSVNRWTEEYAFEREHNISVSLAVLDEITADRSFDDINPEWVRQQDGDAA